MTNRVAFCTFGCRINQYDTETIRTLLEESGRFRTVSLRESADVYVVNTCSVTTQSDATARKAIRRISGERPTAKIIVTGCYAQRASAELAKLPGVVLVLGVADRIRIVSEIEKCLAIDSSSQGQKWVEDPNFPQRIIVSPPSADTFPEIPIAKMMDRSRAVVKIQDGCNGVCSFCIVPQTRGRSRSREPKKIMEQINRLVDNGYREVVLAGIHLGDYGSDLGSGAPTLAKLIGEILTIPGLVRFRLSSIGPGAISEEIIRLMASEEKFARHFHIPLQSGSDEILARMNRDYTVAQFERLIRDITDAIPDCGIGTDIICGFPGESEAHFRETVARITALPISYLHPFPYSARPGSPAEGYANQVPSEERKSRTRVLKQLSRTKNRAFRERHLGHTVTVLLEDQRKGGKETGRVCFGWTDNYLRVAVREVPADTNGLKAVRITEVSDDGLIGVLAS
uniref:Threonylcarbamoyladenosine tRNA methylthiotransferase MtaB n=1 Tax=Candidatus Kentrum sp. MB TaxID=2138164 RepID=A0A451B8I2_9GAMM|nr:MAG: threonylcarbamoyladenosine tRNA methylthiotransferase MtaB [Candidatus Kentron sp. MB]VFK26678.1 MAG: threonylcarbamoyladenosine tRNA methylthiotransferase MtaB [Candidatus Kentron sp. MB]VFK74594.1 MAG: threonylcarbamoyladenosine tRNA methylthiotransferase MtaB [Candidatus Kentron sp. MB]